MNEHVTFNGSPTADGYYTTLSPNEVTVDSSGGGSSDGDFSIAKVTIVNGSVGALSRIYEQDEIVASSPYFGPNDNNSELSVILYKGACIADLGEPENVSGAIEYNEEGDCYIITGDCTVTYSVDGQS